MAQTAAQKARIDQLAQNRLASGASTKNTVTGSAVMPGATPTQLIAQAKTGVPAANQANILKMPTAPVTSTVAKPAPVTTTQPTPIKTTQTAVAAPVTPTSQQATSYDDLAKAQIQQGYDETAKTGTDLGIKTYESIDQQFQDTIKRQREQKALQEQQLALQKSGNNQDAEENKKAISSAAEVQKSQLSDNREGFSSGSNQAASTQLQTAVQQKLARIEQGRLAANAAVESAQKDLDAAELAGNTELAGKYRAKLDLAQQAVQKAEDDHINTQIALQNQQNSTIKNLADTGALDGATPEMIQKLAESYGVDPNTLKAIAESKSYARSTDEDKAKFERQTSAINTFKGLVSEGIALSPNLLLSMSESTGLPVGDLMKFNQTASLVMNDKNLTLDQKQQLIKEKGYELDQLAQGFFTNEQRAWGLYNKMAKSGQFSQEELQNYLMANKMDSNNNPMTQLEMKYKQSVIDGNYGQAAKLKADLYDMGYDENGSPITDSSPTSFKGSTDNSGAMEVDNKTIKDIFYQKGKSDYGHGDGQRECGEGYNDITDGKKVGNSYASKMATVVKRDNPQVGNGLMLPLAYGGGVVKNNSTQPGHIETVIASNGDNIRTISWNRDGKGTPSVQDYSISQLNKNYGSNWGFSDSKLKPSYSKKLTDASPQDLEPNTVSSGGYQKYLSDFKAQGMSPNDAKKLAIEQVKNDLQKGSDGQYSKEQVSLANQYRDEYNGRQSVKDFTTIRDQYNDFKSIVNSDQPSGVGDLALVYGFMKALDPTSVVRESEFNAAANSGNVFNGAFAQFNGKFGTGEKLPPEVRQQFMDLVTKRLNTKAKGLEVDLNRYKDMAKRANLNPDDVVYDYRNDIPDLNTNTEPYKPKSQLVQNFLNDPSANEVDKNNLLKDLQAGSTEQAAENAIRRHFGNKYSQSSADKYNGYNLRETSSDHITSTDSI